MAVPEKAQRARELMQTRGFGVLSTISKRLSGYPFGSTVNFALDGAGRPVFYFSGLAVHTKNLVEDPHASLTVYAEGAEQDPLTSARMNVMGEVRPVPEDEAEEARAAYFARHPEAEQYMGFADFSVYRMDVVDVYYVGGFGAMGWVSPQDYTAAG
ncbi:MAG: pyridoxamine 5'-phosphate oxidase family protein [Acidobacteria bacterium]|nr:pyridoxamine 5'-phosphate oxidase family protein [Acidobacteriota bacterium]